MSTTVYSARKQSKKLYCICKLHIKSPSVFKQEQMNRKLQANWQNHNEKPYLCYWNTLQTSKERPHTCLFNKIVQSI